MRVRVLPRDLAGRIINGSVATMGWAVGAVTVVATIPVLIETLVMRDRADPEAAIAEAVAKYSNWGRWGPDDVLGTVNFIDEEKRRQGAALVRDGVSFSLSQRFDANGPQ